MYSHLVQLIQLVYIVFCFENCFLPQVYMVTTIGFIKEAPMINVHGFNVYHKNRLIMVTNFFSCCKLFALQQNMT